VNPVPVSAYMICYNNARTVERALRSVAGWVDEIVVVDSFSKDGTADIARRYATRFEQHRWSGFRDQYQYAADLCSNEWILFVDDDEEISPELRDEVLAELPRNAALPADLQAQGYYGHRRTFYLGRWILHGGWASDYKIRLYRAGRGRWEGGLHANVHLDGRAEHLRQGFYFHYTYEDIADQIGTIDRYSATAAADLRASGRRFSWLHGLGNPLFRFARDYVLKRGFLDGTPGFIVAVNTAFYVFSKHVKLWELETQASADRGLPPAPRPPVAPPSPEPPPPPAAPR